MICSMILPLWVCYKGLTSLVLDTSYRTLVLVLSVRNIGTVILREIFYFTEMEMEIVVPKGEDGTIRYTYRSF